MRSLAIAAVAALVAAAAFGLPASGQQAPPSGGAGLSLTLPPYTLGLDKPVISVPPFGAKSDSDRSCLPAWTCRVQLFGAVQKYGGVGLKGIAFTW